MAGGTLTFGAGNTDMYILKLDPNGTIQWTRAVGGPNYDFAISIIQTRDGGYALAGLTQSYGAGGYDMYIVKLDANGNSCGNSESTATITGTGGTMVTTTSSVSSPGPTFSTQNDAKSTGGTVTHVCVIGIKPNSNEIPDSYKLYQNYPNPFNPTTKIKFSIPASPVPSKGGGQEVSLKIYDILGKEVESLLPAYGSQAGIPPLRGGQEGLLTPGTYEVEWNALNFPSGIYFYKLIAGDFSQTKKLILLK